MFACPKLQWLSVAEGQSTYGWLFHARLFYLVHYDFLSNVKCELVPSSRYNDGTLGSYTIHTGTASFWTTRNELRKPVELIRTVLKERLAYRHTKRFVHWRHFLAELRARFSVYYVLPSRELIQELTYCATYVRLRTGGSRCREPPGHLPTT